VKDPGEVLHLQQKVLVEVISVDCERKRIALSLGKKKGEKEIANQGEKPIAKQVLVNRKEKFSSNPFASL
jgi:ribosomal protein S1